MRDHDDHERTPDEAEAAGARSSAARGRPPDPPSRWPCVAGRDTAEVQDARIALAEPWVDRDRLLERMAQREAYLRRLRSGEIPRVDGGDPLAEEAVRVRGTDSQPFLGSSEACARRDDGTGHIMATQMLPDGGGGARPGAHYSFSSAGPSFIDIGTGTPPFAGAAPSGVGARPSALREVSDDPHLRAPQAFDHAFDPRFIDPARFARSTREAQARSRRQPNLADLEREEISRLDCGSDSSQEAVAAARTQARRRLAANPPSPEDEYRLMSVPVDRPQEVRDGVRTGPGRDPRFDPHDPRVAEIAPPGGGAPVRAVPAQNCATKLMSHLASMGVLTRADFLLLGGNAKGEFLPGSDLTPTQLYEHLRWREHEFVEELRRAQAAA